MFQTKNMQVTYPITYNSDTHMHKLLKAKCIVILYYSAVWFVVILLCDSMMTKKRAMFGQITLETNFTRPQYQLLQSYQ